MVFQQRAYVFALDGSQRIEGLDADEILDALADDYLHNNDLRSAMQRLQMNGMQGQDGQRMMGLREMLDRLRNQKQSRQGRYNMSGVMDDIREKLEAVKQHEREGIQRRLDETGQNQPQVIRDNREVNLTDRSQGKLVNNVRQVNPASLVNPANLGSRGKWGRGINPKRGRAACLRASIPLRSARCWRGWRKRSKTSSTNCRATRRGRSAN